MAVCRLPTKLLLILALVAVVPRARAETFTPDQLERRSVERRAVEAVLWGMPAVNFELMVEAFQKVGGAPNQVAYWSRPLNWKNQTLTPNPDTIYLMPFYDTRNGPSSWRSRRRRADRSPAASTTPGRTRWKTSAPPAPIRARAPST